VVEGAKKDESASEAIFYVSEKSYDSKKKRKVGKNHRLIDD
jgi:hypothetical protein